MKKGWNAADYVVELLTDGPKGTAVERVARWEQRFDAPTTGVRIEDGLVALDFDIEDEDMMDRLLAALAEIAPDVYAKAPRRYGGGRFEVALFARLAEGEELFVRLASRKYNEEEHCLEAFGGDKRDGRCTRQFTIYGPHSFNDDGTVAREYRWATDRPALHEVDFKNLPVITRVQVAALLDKFDAFALAAGWQPVVPELNNTNPGAVYDITDQTRFDTNRGGCQISYDELVTEFEIHGEGLRVSSNFMPKRGPSGDTERCWVCDNNRHGCVAVYVYGDAAVHYPVEFEPVEDWSVGLLGDFLRARRATFGDGWQDWQHKRSPSPRWLDMSNWDHEKIPEREWAIPGRVPLNQVGLFSGEGGIGKSIIELMKNVAHVAGADWLGALPTQGGAFYLGAEDDDR